MQAIITIDFRDYLVPDAKKALAFIEMLQKAKVVARDGSYVRDQIRITDDPVRAEMCVVPATTKIIPAKKAKS